MNEAEWLACADPAPMIAFLRGSASDRKLRLLACACCRRAWGLLSDRHSRKALSVAERFADGEVTEGKLRFAWGDARRAAQVAHRQERQTADGTAMWAVALLCEADVGVASAAVELAARCEAHPIDPVRLAEAKWAQMHLLRCLFANPFRPLPVVTFSTATITSLALAAYFERVLPSGGLDHARLAILADALEEAGAGGELLAHLRSPGPHVRGCWVVDLVLSRQ